MSHLPKHRRSLFKGHLVGNRAPLLQFTGHGREGATMVEFTLVASLLFILIFAGIEFARANLLRHTANHAAYEAARHAMVPGATKEEALDKAKLVLENFGVTDVAIKVTPSTITEDTTSVRVDIEIPIDRFSWGVMRFMKNRVLTAHSELLTERAPMVLAQALPTLPPPKPAPPKPTPPKPVPPKPAPPRPAPPKPTPTKPTPPKPAPPKPAPPKPKPPKPKPPKPKPPKPAPPKPAPPKPTPPRL